MSDCGHFGVGHRAVFDRQLASHRARASMVASAILVAVIGATSSLAADTASKDEPISLERRLESLHREASTARAKGNFANVERLRLERRRMIADSAEASRWKAGIEAIDKATVAVERMEYEKACKLLQAAWEPFASLPSRQAVFGDLAMELFLASEAARMVDPSVALVPQESLKKWLTRASADDPCQVEVEAARAFLTPPNSDETMRRLDDRRFVRERNERLLAIERETNGGGEIFPWHAPVEYLKAKSSSFVLRDLEYLRSFLDPRARLFGSNRHGETWCLVLGGGILVASTEQRSGQVRSLLAIDSYDAAAREWRRFTPQIVVVSAASELNPGEWQLDAGDVATRLNALLPGLETEFRRQADDRLVSIAGGFPPEVVVAVRQIREGTWPRGPQAGAPIDAVLQTAAGEFETYATNLLQKTRQRDQADAARRAQREIAGVREVFLQNKDLQGKVTALAVKFEGSAADVAALRAVVEATDFPDHTPSAPTTPEDDSGLDAFGAAPAPAASALVGAQLKARLLEALGEAELLVACQSFRMSTLPVIGQAANEADQRIGGSQDAPPFQRSAALQLKEAVRRLGELLAAVDASAPEQRKPLKLGDFEAIRRQMENVLAACFLLDSSSSAAIAVGVERFMDAYRTVVVPVEDGNRILRLTAGQRPVRSWRVGAVDWNFHELIGIPALEGALLVDIFPPLVVGAADLDVVSKHLEEGGEDPAPPSVRPGSATSVGSLVDADRRLRVRMPPPGRPLVQVVLVEQEGNGGTGGPRAFTDDNGRPILVVNDAGDERSMRLDLDAGELVVEYPGVEGHLPIGITADPAKVPRYLRDKRGYKISSAPAGTSRIFDVIAANGERIDVGYHSITDLIGIDRNVVNNFVPAAVLYAPSLPAWHVYREELLRRAPDARVRWAIPRPAFRKDD